MTSSVLTQSQTGRQISQKMCDAQMCLFLLGEMSRLWQMFNPSAFEWWIGSAERRERGRMETTECSVERCFRLPDLRETPIYCTLSSHWITCDIMVYGQNIIILQHQIKAGNGMEDSHNNGACLLWMAGFRRESPLRAKIWQNIVGMGD